jgi:hypothetical protein
MISHFRARGIGGLTHRVLRKVLPQFVEVRKSGLA